jgi:hypothetical protein
MRVSDSLLPCGREENRTESTGLCVSAGRGAHLTGEYEALGRKLAGVLARKRPSPLTSGKPESWVCGIVRVIGRVNFLDDSTQPGHMKLTAIDKALGVSQAMGQAKSKAIRDLLKIRTFDPQWTLPIQMEKNPLIWMIPVNGLIVDVRYVPGEIQEEAFRQGLIPYISADRSAKGENEEKQS